jgi:sulfite exporter TauE/SafE
VTFVYLFTMGLSAETVVETQKVHLIVLAGGLFPCLFAYAFTRVVYGVEVLVEG